VEENDLLNYVLCSVGYLRQNYKKIIQNNNTQNSKHANQVLTVIITVNADKSFTIE